jgi:hypothetical protein
MDISIYQQIVHQMTNANSREELKAPAAELKKVSNDDPEKKDLVDMFGQIWALLP